LRIEHGGFVDDLSFAEDVGAHGVDFVCRQRAGRRERHGAADVIEQRRGIGPVAFDRGDRFLRSERAAASDQLQRSTGRHVWNVGDAHEIGAVTRRAGGLIDLLAARVIALLRVIEDLAGDWRRLDERIGSLSSEIEVLARRDAGCERLMSVPGIGPIISSAMVAAIGTGDAFTKGRDFAAWLGLGPKQISNGARTILGKISKRGNRYLRVLFVQAAWVVLIKPKSWDRHGLKPWLEAAKKRLHHNVLAIALANKLARIAWSILAHGRTFEASKIQAACTQRQSSKRLTCRGLREDENAMEDRSSRRMRTLVTQMAH